MKNRRRFFFSAIIVAFIFNIYTLFSQSIRLDESQSIWVATKSIGGILKIDAEDVHVPLYTLLLHFWVQIFGTDIIPVRFLSLIFYILTLPILYTLSKESGGDNVALLTVTFFSVSPFIMWYSTEARMYTLFTLTVGLSHLYFLRLLRTDGHEGKIGYLVSTVLGIFTHYFFLLLLTTQLIYVLGRFVKNLRSGSYGGLRFMAVYFPFLFFSLLPFFPWMLFVRQLGSAANTQPLLSRPGSYNLIQLFVNFMFGFQGPNIQSALVSLWPLSVILIFFVFTHKENHRVPTNLTYFLMSTFVPILIVFLVSYIRPIFLSRYLILVAPSLFFLGAWLILNRTQRLISALSFLIVGIMLVSLVAQNTSAAAPVGEDYRDVSLYLSRQATPHDIIAVSAPFTVYPIEYSYKGLTRIDTIPAWNRYRKGAIPSFNAQSLIEQVAGYRRKYNRLFLVLSYDQGYENETREYFDKNYHLEEEEVYPPDIKLRVYRLRYDVSWDEYLDRFLSQN